MKVNMVKLRGGMMQPLDDLDADEMDSLQTGEVYEVSIKRARNPQFHRKVFAFFHFCFEHWDGGDIKSTKGQFDVFRSHLTVLSGYYDSFHTINGDTRIEAKSIAYGSMTQQEFEHFYIALTNAAMKHIFKTTDDATYNRLIAFF